MKKQVEVVVCDNCGKHIALDGEVFEKENVKVDDMDFCSSKCVIEFVKKPHTRKCHVCGGKGYTYIDAGYGDDDVRCTACKNGTEPVPSSDIFKIAAYKLY